MIKVIKSRHCTMGMPVFLDRDEEVVSAETVERKEAAAEAAAWLAQSEQEAARRLAAARQQVVDMMTTARGEAAKIIDDARQQADWVVDSARQSGYADGQRDGLAVAQAQALALVAEAEAMKAAALADREAILRSLEGEIISLAVSIASKVVGQEISVCRDSLLSLVRQAVRRVAGAGHLTLHLSEKNAAVLREKPGDQSLTAGSRETVTLQSEPELGPGDFLVESDCGTLDAGIGTQLQMIETELREAAGYGI